MADFSLAVTDAGLSMITDTAFGGTIIFTGILLGSGSTSESAQSMSSLVKEEVSLPISSCTKNGSTVVLKAELQPDDVTETFTWREVGIKAKSSSDGVEILYAYGNAGNLGDTIPGPESGTLDERILEFSVIVGNTSNVVAELKSGLYVSKEELEIVAKGMVVTLTHSKEGTVHVFTGLEGKTGLVPCQFKSTYGYTEGDTATIDGEAYTIVLTSADEPETDLFITGRSIIVDVNTTDKTINFSSGGGGSTAFSQAVTLTTSGWTLDTDGRYKQTVSVTGITSETPVIVVDCDLTGIGTPEDKIAVLEAWQQGPSVYEVIQGEGTLTFFSVEVPAVDIPVNVGVC